MKLFFCAYLVFSLTAFSPFMHAYGLQDGSGFNHELPPGKIISLLSEKHQVPIFFMEQWFDQQVLFPGSILDLSLPDALAQIVKDRNLQIIALSGNLILVPIETPPASGKGSTDQQAIIGNPNEFGRYSRAALQGKISDGNTGELLAGAVLFDPVSATGVSTDANGAYSIVLPVGDHRLRVSYLGYQERYQDIRLLSPGMLDMDLFTGSAQLQEVTIMARRAEEHVARTQMSMITLDSKTIKELPGTFGEPDIIRSLSLLPGIQTIGEFGTGFNVRGGGSDQNLILVENAPLFNSSHFFGLISVVNPDLVSSMSLIKAGTPAKYGERASSVIDIRLGNGLSTQETSFKAGLGLLNSRLMVETPVIKDKATLSLAGRTSNSDFLLSMMPTEDLLNSSAGFYDLTGVSTIALGNKNRLNLFGYLSQNRFRYQEESNYESQNLLGSLRWSSVLGPGLTSNLILSISEYHLQLKQEDARNFASQFLMTSQVQYKSFRWILALVPNNNHLVEFGLNGVRYDIQPGEMAPGGIGSIIQHKRIDPEQALELAAFVSDDFVINESLSMELGLRFTHYLYLGPVKKNIYAVNKPRTIDNITGTDFFEKGEIAKGYKALEPRLGIRLKTGLNSSLKVSYAQIHQYINLISNNSVMGPTDVWKLSDNHLKPMRSNQYVLGYFQNFFGNTVEFSAEAYYKAITNTLEYRSGAEIAMNEYIETDILNADGYNYGLELYVKKNTGRLSGWTSYTFSSSRVGSNSPFPESQINGNNSFPSNYDRPHNLVVNGNYQISRRWRFSAIFTYNTGRPVTLPELTLQQGNNWLIHYSDRNKYRLPDYHRLDLSISLNESLKRNKKGTGSWTFSVINVYGRKNPFSVFYKKDPGGMWSTPNFKLYQMFIIARPLPTITYNLNF